MEGIPIDKKSKSYGNELMHEVLLSAMKDIDNICRKNNIKYFLHAGTLLGAINYQGFIPWDDDVDITIFYEDYQKLQDILQAEYSDKYFVQTYKTDYFHPDNRMKIRINGTKFNTVGEYDKRLKNNGIFIDIAPLYRVPNKKNIRYIQKKLILIIDLAIQAKLGLIELKSIKSKILLKPLSSFDRVFLGDLMNLIMSKMGNEKSNDVGTLSCTFRNEYMDIDGYENDIRPCFYYQEAMDISFEGHMFMTTKMWHEDLLRRYGEAYNKPYPEEKRITKHGLEDFCIDDTVLERIRKCDF